MLKVNDRALGMLIMIRALPVQGTGMTTAHLVMPVMTHGFRVIITYSQKDPDSSSWIRDPVISPCIDVGDPISDWYRKPAPIGGRINMGSHMELQLKRVSPELEGKRRRSICLTGRESRLEYHR